MAAALVPELSVTDWAASRRFYHEVLGFGVRYERPEEGFSYLALGAAELMIDQLGVGRDFDADLSAAARPFGRGTNLQIEVADAAELSQRVVRAGYALRLPLEDKWYRVGAAEEGNRQFLLEDPDGYMLRFFQDLGPAPQEHSIRSAQR
ncbi:VOC family protein [Phaeobacter sp. HF9A]|uniref:bleomycin resistance protein n=1 Tax=Phaeobacter sp. HF9A TaxID=2721561 RepID=UPI00142FF862|nr:VOC family protein [Phaeobacter sp. HF9A]NIZ13813.1 VOC family protein [Phaeobacter sp. HF9A]